MAIQAGAIYITGCFENTCFYCMNGKYYARMKSSLEGTRVKKDPAFRETMRYAALLAKASKIASGLYRLLPNEEREKGLYRELVGQVMRLLKEGKSEIEITELMQQRVSSTRSNPVAANKKNAEEGFDFANEVIRRVFSSDLKMDEDLFPEGIFIKTGAGPRPPNKFSTISLYSLFSTFLILL